ncbi:HER229Cp [Eremothecium sinecaudum]|uniref:HER229Cp n=1 Tax=Eremothecium sinecaudum TaxID=45286 RepID=A0A0X8HU49_9SACH|nr:HER229Cp [Eremothecium sinecaudum]AMD21507.1 HER229Cp [Eremothecium sinecaudum]
MNMDRELVRKEEHIIHSNSDVNLTTGLKSLDNDDAAAKSNATVNSEIENNEKSSSREHDQSHLIYGTSDDSEEDFKYEEAPLWRKLMYDFFLWIFTKVFDCFFREIRTRDGYKVPSEGPIIFVAAPHANQFVDPVILMCQVKKIANRRISFLIAAKSLKAFAVGTLARCAMAIGVARAQDNLRPAAGRIKLHPDDPRRIIGIGTEFTKYQEKGLIGLPKSLGNIDIETIISDTELILRKEFKMQKPEVRNILTKGTPFKYAPKVNQSQVYHRVFEHLAHGQCIGIFPEGGSHDRTDLLPLKAGVAIMALGCMSKHPDVSVKIVPCGMNYFHPHRFRSRAVVEFGDPIEVSPDLVAKYSNAETNKQAVKELLDTITEGLKAVTLTCSDYETLMLIQAARRLYAGQLSSKLPLPLVVEMNRRLVRGYEEFKDDPQVMKLRENVLKYNEHLAQYNIPDHQVEHARLNFYRNLQLLLSRSIRLLFTFLLALPGVIMFSPVFLIAKRISKKKAQQALAASTVKIKANDVIATWKILMGIVVAPMLYIFWSILIVWYFRDTYTKGNYFLSFIIAYICSAAVTYSALSIGDIGMDIFKSLRPLYLSITTPKGLQTLKEERQVLAAEITEIVNTIGPKLFPDFDGESLRKKYQSTGVSLEDEEDRKTQELKRRKMLKKKRAYSSYVEVSPVPTNTEYEERVASDDDSDAVSMVNSDNSLSFIPIFSSVHRTDSMSSLSSMSSEYDVEESLTKHDGLSGIVLDAVRKNRK